MFMKACRQTATGTLSNTNVSLLDQCLYDGPEIGSTGLLRVKEITGKERPSIIWGDSCYCPKTINANDNFASEELRLAA